jgi:hypothetical protein
MKVSQDSRVLGESKSLRIRNGELIASSNARVALALCLIPSGAACQAGALCEGLDESLIFDSAVESISACDLPGTFAGLNLRAHFLDLRGLLVELCREDFHVFLKVADRYFLLCSIRY